MVLSCYWCGAVGFWLRVCWVCGWVCLVGGFGLFPGDSLFCSYVVLWLVRVVVGSDWLLIWLVLIWCIVVLGVVLVAGLVCFAVVFV